MGNRPATLMARLPAVYDANILYPAPLRDLFIRLAQAGLVRAKSNESHP